MNPRKHFLVLVLVPALLILCVTSYVRFMVNHDYMVAYEGECDPATQSCFMGCEDDECTEPYYYSQVTKYAADVYEQCGPDITGCAAAQECREGDRGCTIVFCDVDTDGDLCEAEGEPEL